MQARVTDQSECVFTVVQSVLSFLSELQGLASFAIFEQFVVQNPLLVKGLGADTRPSAEQLNRLFGQFVFKQRNTRLRYFLL